MRKLIKACILILAIVSTCTSCGLIPNLIPSERRLFSISENFEKLPVFETPRELVMLVKDTASDSFINSNRIIFGDSEHERGFYRFASWVESPPAKFSSLLLRAIENSNLVKSISRTSGSVIGDLQVNTEMIECYHHTSPGRGTARVKVRVELLSLNNRSVLASKEFSNESPVNNYNADGAVMAINSAINQTVVDIVIWLDKQI